MCVSERVHVTLCGCIWVGLQDEGGSRGTECRICLSLDGCVLF